VLVYLLIRLNREYRMESDVLENMQERRKFGTQGKTPNYSRRVVLIFVDSVDLATFAAIRYARGLRPTSMRAVHFVIDAAHAEKVRADWVQYGQEIPLEMIDTPDRRLNRAAAELAVQEAAPEGTHVTVVLPRRSFSPLLGRLLHDRTADQLSAVVSRVPNCAATIVPFDVETRVAELHARHDAKVVPAAAAEGGVRDGAGVVLDGGKDQPVAAPAVTVTGNGSRPPVPDGVTPIGDLVPGGPKGVVEGRVRAVEIRPVEQNCGFECTVDDDTGSLTAMFYGRTGIPGVGPGSRVRLEGKVSVRSGGRVMANPAYELIVSSD
jgi:hypothetical protein